MTAEADRAFDVSAGGAPPRYIDPVTERLGGLAKSFEDVQGSRKRAEARDQPELAADLTKIEARLSRQLGKALRSHVLWPFLEPLKGLSGPLSARVISMIQDPTRFPGQPCTEGHILRPIFPAGSPCPVALADLRVADETTNGEGDSSGTEFLSASEKPSGAGPSSPTGVPLLESEGVHACGGTMLPPRTTTGVSSLWHYGGLHATPEGKLPMRRKGVVADWKPGLRTICLQKDGIADQIIRHKRDENGNCGTCSSRGSKKNGTWRYVPTVCGTLHYSDIYHEKKESKLLAEYPLWRAHKIARIVAVKAYLGDLLMEWKAVIA